MITDQAAKLRAMVAEMERNAPPSRAVGQRTGCARTLAVTSGKGGVGKTNLSLNLAIAVSRLGHRVVLLDADFGLANVDVLANLRTRYNISHVIDGSRNIIDIVTEGPEGVLVVPGASGLSELADLGEDQRERLIAQLDYLGTMADLLIIDTAAGISQNVLRFLAAADEIVVLVTPEPTSIIDSYATVKVLTREADYGYIHLVVNMVSGRKEADAVAGHFMRVARDFLRVPVNYAGYVLRDPALEDAVRRRTPLLLQHPKSQAAACVAQVLRGLGVRRISERSKGDGFFRKFFSAFSRSRQ
ncbi:MAG: MinD/ParA family protein [Planctomycetota bacterium]